MSENILWVTTTRGFALKQQRIPHAIQSVTDFAIHQCNSEEQTMLVAEKLRPTVILLTMQGNHCLDILRSYKKHPLLSHIPIIIIGCHTPKAIRNYAFFLGCSDYVETTVSLQELLARIHQQHAMYMQEVQYHESQKSLKAAKKELLEKQYALEKLSSLDALTGIANRQSFSQHYEREWSRALRETEPLSVLIANIDHFKAYNDHYGYKQGDMCLKKVAQVMQDVLQRPTDFCARYCGEEFIILLPTTTAKGGIYIAEKLRKAVIDLNIPHKHSETQAYLTLSLGLATTSPMLKHKANDLIRAADHARFEAKKQGRNRLICKSL